MIVKCLTPGCSREAALAMKRGLCMSCHGKANKLIAAGKTTWNKLVEVGLATKTDIADPFTKAFNDRIKET